MRTMRVVLIVVVVGFSARAGAGTVLHLATPDPEMSAISVTAASFADRVAAMTGGEVVIEVHPDGVLFDGDSGRAIKMLGSGSLDMLALSASLYATRKPRFIALGIPYLFDSPEQLHDYLASDTADALLDDIEDLGIHPLALWPRAFRVMTNAKRRIRVPGDLEGLRIRVPGNPLWVEFFRAMGAVPTPMPFGEVYQALESGLVDGQENPFSIVLDANLYKVQKYLSITDHMADAWVLGINREKWESFSEGTKQAMREAAVRIRDDKARLDLRNPEVIEAFLESRGMEIHHLTPDEKKLFLEAALPLYPRFGAMVKDAVFFQKTLEFVGKN